MPVSQEDTKLEVRLRLRVDVDAKVIGEFTNKEEMLKWLAEEDNQSSVIGGILSMLERSSSTMTEIGWLDDNRQVYIEELAQVDLINSERYGVRED